MVFNEEWVLGPVACKVLLYVQIVTLASTTFILVAMSLDRLAVAMVICVAMVNKTRLGYTRVFLNEKNYKLYYFNILIFTSYHIK